MKMSYEVTIKIEAQNMYEVADALTKAASEPLMARLLSKDTVIKTHEAPPVGVNFQPKVEVTR